MMSSLPVEVGQVVAEKYQVDSVIGRGGMGVVVEAHHIKLDQRVAIKFLLAEVAQHADAAERFRREARAVAQLHSDHAVRVLDVGSLPGDIPFIVMEHLDGRDLGQRMSTGETISIEEAVGYALETIDAIGEAHKLGIIHRDLKPANLFLAKRPDGSSRIKVLDFGISKSLLDSSLSDMRLTSTATLIGSPLYMSPEQMQSARDVDARADIWSLGAIVFEMLAKRPPYQANTLPELCQAISNSDPPKLREFRPDVPEGLEQAIGLCLKRDLAQRWSNVMDLAQALAPFAPRRRGQRELSKNSTNAELGADGAGDSSPGHAAPNLGTLNAWQTSQHKKRQRKQAVRVVLVLMLVLGALGLLLLLPKHNPGPARPQASSLAPPAAQAPARAASPRGASPAVQQAEPQRANTSVEQREAAVVAPVHTESDASGHPTPSVVPAGRGSRPPAHDSKPVVQPPVNAIAPTAAGPVGKKPKPPEELSDFGGRR